MQYFHLVYGYPPMVGGIVITCLKPYSEVGSWAQGSTGMELGLESLKRLAGFLVSAKHGNCAPSLDSHDA